MDCEIMLHEAEEQGERTQMKDGIVTVIVMA